MYEYDKVLIERGRREEREEIKKAVMALREKGYSPGWNCALNDVDKIIEARGSVKPEKIEKLKYEERNNTELMSVKINAIIDHLEALRAGDPLSSFSSVKD